MGIFIIIVVVVFLIGFISRYKEDGTAKDGAEGGIGCLIGLFILALIIFMLIGGVKTCVDPSEGYRRQVEDAYNLYD